MVDRHGRKNQARQEGKETKTDTEKDRQTDRLRQR